MANALRNAWAEITLRARSINELDLPGSNYLFAPAILMLRTCPVPMATPRGTRIMSGPKMGARS